jgi:hypothetical protein
MVGVTPSVGRDRLDNRVEAREAMSTDERVHVRERCRHAAGERLERG